MSKSSRKTTPAVATLPPGFDPNIPLDPANLVGAVAEEAEVAEEPEKVALEMPSAGNCQLPTQKTVENKGVSEPANPPHGPSRQFRFGEVVPPSVVVLAAKAIHDSDPVLVQDHDTNIAFINGDELTLLLPPLVELTEAEKNGYASTHVNVQLRGQEAYAMKRLVRSLQDANVRLDGGKGHHVRTAADAVRWIIQNVCSEA